ncbi:MAG: hypothetical protein Q8M92_00715 [Candidatus Subteraquimicrobiales bacterium]|nr:hypothetical protein [Candidatus Subteraquimicrobiales bacterium]
MNTVRKVRGRRLKLTATFVEGDADFGAALFQNISDGNRIIAEQIWVSYVWHFDMADMERGDVIGFDARVRFSEKEPDIGFRLVYLSQVKILKRENESRAA